jgi:hypothetical protein
MATYRRWPRGQPHLPYRESAARLHEGSAHQVLRKTAAWMPLFAFLRTIFQLPYIPLLPHFTPRPLHYKYSAVPKMDSLFPQEVLVSSTAIIESYGM